MSNKKVKPCENFEFLPETYQNKEELDMSQKNVLSTLCFSQIRYSDWVRKHNGWFFTSIKEIADESNIDLRTVARVLIKLELKRLISRKPGTNHKCTSYKLCEDITSLLPQIEPENEEPEEANVTLVKNSLEKLRLDESSKDESSLVKDSIEEYDDSYLPF